LLRYLFGFNATLIGGVVICGATLWTARREARSPARGLNVRLP
jgi:hypothetical protein